MIPAVVLVLALVSPAFTFPFTTQDAITTGIQGTTGTVGEGTQTGFGTIGTGITGEKTGLGTHEVTQTTTQQGVQIPVDTQQVVDSVRPIFHEEKTGAEVFQPVTQQVEPVKVQTYSEGVNQPQERPLLLPVQPLTVVPVTQGQILAPVETIAAGRLIIMAIEPIRRFLTQEVTVTEKVVPVQQVVEQVPVQQPIQQVLEQVPVQQPVQQVYNVQPEPVKQVPYQQELLPVQNVEPVQYVPVKQVPVQQELQPVQNIEPAQYVPVKQVPVQQEIQQAVQSQQLPQVQQQVLNVQPEVPVKQVLYVPVQTPNVEQVQEQQINEKTGITQTQTQIQTQITGTQGQITPIVTTKSNIGNVPVETQQQVQKGSVQLGQSVLPVTGYTQSQVEQVNPQQVQNVQQIGEKQGFVPTTTGVTQGQTKSQELEVQPQSVAGNFGDKIQPNNQVPVQTLSVVPQNQQQTPIVVPQQQSSVVVPQVAVP